MTYKEFTHLLIAKDMTRHIKSIIKNPQYDLKHEYFCFYQDNNDHDIETWYLVRPNMFADLETKLNRHEITHFKWEGELWIGLTTDVKNDQKLRALYEDYLLG